MKPNTENNIWLFAEQRDGKLLPVYKEILAKARQLAAEISGCRVCTLLVGSNIKAAAEEGKQSGGDMVYYIDDARLADYNCRLYAAAIEDVITQFKPLAFFWGATAIGSELAPTLAARLKTGLAAHCVEISWQKQGILSFLVPAFGGKLSGEIFIPKQRPQMATVRPGIFSGDIDFPRQEAQIVELPCPPLPEPAISFVSYTPKPKEEQSLDEAELVIGCGRGVATDANFNNLQRLAQRLNAPIAFTRPAIDMGWAEDESAMIGSSGKAIKPRVYLNFGISGAMHHICGVSKSGTIISVNKDAKAKMFNISDYKVAADSGSIINALLKALD